MFAERFTRLIAENPGDAVALGNLSDYFRKIEEKDPRRFSLLELELRKLYDESGVDDRRVLERILKILLGAHVLKRILKVESANGTGVAFFSSYAEVPDFVRDITRDINIEVTQENLKVIYRPLLT